MAEYQTKLVDGERLLAALFDEQSRPSEYWLADQRKARRIPFKQVGRLIFYDVEQVRLALDQRYTIQARQHGRQAVAA
jgi:hypothetical protein